MILKKLNLKKIGDFGFSKKHYSTNKISFIFTIMKKIILLITFFLLSNTAFSQSLSSNNLQFTGEKYVTGDDGVVRIYVNVWGHVQNPGSYLIFDGANIIDILSLAGGPKNGANVKKIKILSKNEKEEKIISLQDINDGSINLVLKPFDTIIINQTRLSKLNESSRIYTIMLQLVNLLYTIERLD